MPSIDHNLYVHNGLVFAANYTSGLRVLDHADIASGNLTEVAYIDTHPAKDSLTSYDGAWSSYPFFASGSIIIGDRNEGLIVVRLLQSDLTVTAEDAPDPAHRMVLSISPTLYCCSSLCCSDSRKRCVYESTSMPVNHGAQMHPACSARPDDMILQIDQRLLKPVLIDFNTTC